MSRILIVDDDPQLGRSLARVLERAGHTSKIASDPTSAVAAGAEFKPEALLIELQPQHASELPQLREALGAIPFLFMTGHRDQFARLGELVGSSDDWLAKPAAPEEIIVRLRTALRRLCTD
jgi:DNA-binding response OmpR family regulator